MFFVGLAGSFMPYLLFLGTLIALTLGVKENHNPEKITLAEKTIEYQAADQSVSSTNNYYYFGQNEEKHTQQSVHLAFVPNYNSIDYPPRGKTMEYFVPKKYSYLATYNYSGLSPPALIS